MQEGGDHKWPGGHSWRAWLKQGVKGHEETAPQGCMRQNFGFFPAGLLRSLAVCGFDVEFLQILFNMRVGRRSSCILL